MRPVSDCTTRRGPPKIYRRSLYTIAVPHVEVATTSNVFVGQCAGLTGSTRLLDLLKRDSQLLVLADCWVRNVGRVGEPLSLARICFVQKERIVWARPLGLADRSRSATMVVDKERHSMIAVAPPFRITGETHVLPGADATLALARLVDGFLPVTHATIELDGDKPMAWNAEVVLLNGKMTDIISADSEKYVLELPSGLEQAS